MKTLKKQSIKGESEGGTKEFPRKILNELSLEK
jgi:hypothetical protein